MEVNQNAPVLQNNQILIQATPEKVWAVLAGIDNWVKWNKHISKAQLQGDPVAGAGFTWKVNGASIRSVLHTSIPGKAFGWSGTTFGGSAIHNWHLQNTDGGTLVKVEESMEGWLVGLFKNKMNSDLERDMQYWLEALKKECEKA